MTDFYGCPDVLHFCNDFQERCRKARKTRRRRVRVVRCGQTFRTTSFSNLPLPPVLVDTPPMHTSKGGSEPNEPAPHIGDPVQMDLNRGRNQGNAQVPPSSSTLPQVSIHGAAPNPKTRKLSLEERLSRLSEYRVLETDIESVAEPSGTGGAADVVWAYFKRQNEVWGERVAAKKLRWPDITGEEKFSKEFVHEVELLAGLSHKNIVRLVGFMEDLKHQKAWIVLSWEPNGNVREFLKKGKWAIPERISLIQDMFRGLKYLHTREPPICHGDIKSLNILVSSSFHAVITDFGSARVMRNKEVRPDNQDKMQNAGEVAAADEGESCRDVTVFVSANQLTLSGPLWTLRWAAPEVVNGEALPGLASDIWSAGWVCWEMMTGKIPFESVKRESAIQLKVMQREVPMIHEDTEVAQVGRLCSLMTDCWKCKPEDRPHAGQCCNEVRWMPSLPPSRGTHSSSKELLPTLLLEEGYMHYSQNRHEKAATLFEKVVTNTHFAVPRKVLAQALKYLGDVYHAQCKDSEAEESYTRAQEIYTRIGDEQGRANTLNGLGNVYRLQRKYAEAEEFYTQAQKIYARIGDKQGRANTLNGLGHVYRLQSKDTEAEELYTRAQEIYARIGNDQGRANALNGLGSVYRLQRKYAEAQEAYMRAQEIYSRVGDDQGRADTIAGSGGVYRLQRNYAVAEKAYTEAQEIYARLGADQGQANTLNGLGGVYRLQRKYEEAQGAYTRAEEIYARIGADQGRANTLDGLGDVYRAQDKYAEAEESYNRAEEIYARIGNDLGQANTLNGLGGVYRLQCKYAEAEESYTRAQEIYARTGGDLGQANTLNRLGGVYRVQRKYIKAREAYVRAQDIYTRIGDDHGRADALQSLGHLYRKQGHKRDACRCYAEARDLYSQIGRTVEADDTSHWLDTVSNGWKQRTWSSCRKSFSHYSSKTNIIRLVRLRAAAHPTSNDSEQSGHL